MKKNWLWMSYDLGIKGDYQGLYSWIDDHEGKECGNSVAYLCFEYDTDVLPELEKDLKTKVNFQPGDRIYIVRIEKVNQEKKIRGRFIIGNRKANPWEGYGTIQENIVDEDE